VDGSTSRRHGHQPVLSGAVSSDGNQTRTSADKANTRPPARVCLSVRLSHTHTPPCSALFVHLHSPRLCLSLFAVGRRSAQCARESRQRQRSHRQRSTSDCPALHTAFLVDVKRYRGATPSRNVAFHCIR